MGRVNGAPLPPAKRGAALASVANGTWVHSEFSPAAWRALLGPPNQGRNPIVWTVLRPAVPLGAAAAGARRLSTPWRAVCARPPPTARAAPPRYGLGGSAATIARLERACAASVAGAAGCGVVSRRRRAGRRGRAPPLARGPLSRAWRAC